MDTVRLTSMRGAQNLSVRWTSVKDTSAIGLPSETPVSPPPFGWHDTSASPASVNEKSCFSISGYDLDYLFLAAKLDKNLDLYACMMKKC